MKVTLWGTRGSLATPGAETARYGGNTSCIQIEGPEGGVLVLDAGTGIRRLGAMIPSSARRIDILLTHLHLDHILGLGFFAPLDNPDCQVHIWGPASTTEDLRTRLTRYLSPPLFPVHLRDLRSQWHLHETPCAASEVGEFRIRTALVCHPGPTVGYRISTASASLAYLPDHEPALGAKKFPLKKEWTSGYSLAEGVDLLVHDAQYSQEEYPSHIGWGHSSLEHTLAFAKQTGVKQLVPFHYDPSHNDDALDERFSRALANSKLDFAVTPGKEGAVFELGIGQKNLPDFVGKIDTEAPYRPE